MMEKIIWKDVVGFEGLYKVNQYGEIYSNYTNKILKYSISQDGYKQYNLHKSKKAYIMTAHKAVAMAFIPNPDNLPLINHKDEDKLNCYFKNLEWCTYSYNVTYNNITKRRVETALNNLQKIYYVYNIAGELLYNDMNLAEFCRQNNMPRATPWNSLSFNRENDYMMLRATNGLIFSDIELTQDDIVIGVKKYQETFKNYIGRDEKGRIKKGYISPLSKRVRQLSLERELIKEYKSTQEVHRETGISQSLIARACRLGVPSHGFYWEYI